MQMGQEDRRDLIQTDAAAHQGPQGSVTAIDQIRNAVDHCDAGRLVPLQIDAGPPLVPKRMA